MRAVFNPALIACMVIAVCACSDKSRAAGAAKVAPDRPQSVVVLTSAAMVARAQARIAAGDESYLRQWRLTLARADAALTKTWHAYTGDDHVAYWGTARTDGFDLRALALAYRLTKNPAYFAAALAGLRVWSEQEDQYPPAVVPAPQATGLVIGRFAVIFADAYNLLLPELPPDLVAAAQQRFHVWYKTISACQQFWWHGELPGFAPPWLGGQEFNNHLSAQTMGMLALAYTMHDPAAVAAALRGAGNPRPLAALLNGAILIPGKSRLFRLDPTMTRAAPPPLAGEMYDRYRVLEGLGLHYTHLQLRFLMLAAHMAYENGDGDYFAYQTPDGGSLETALNLYADVLLTGKTDAISKYYKGDAEIDPALRSLYSLASRHYPTNAKIARVIEATERSFDNQTFAETWTYLF